MTTKIIVTVGASIATVVLMFVLGRMADGKSDDTEKKEASGISVGLFDTDSGVKRCEHGAQSAECLQRAA